MRKFAVVLAVAGVSLLSGCEFNWNSLWPFGRSEVAESNTLDAGLQPAQIDAEAEAVQPTPPAEPIAATPAEVKPEEKTEDNISIPILKDSYDPSSKYRRLYLEEQGIAKGYERDAEGNLFLVTELVVTQSSEVNGVKQNETVTKTARWEPSKYAVQDVEIGKMCWGNSSAILECK